MLYLWFPSYSEEEVSVTTNNTVNENLSNYVELDNVLFIFSYP